MTYVYTVKTTFDDEPLFWGFVDWLLASHLEDVAEAMGAKAELLLLDTAGGRHWCVEARYRVPSREAYEAYERDDAPRLRAEAMAALTGIAGRDASGSSRFERSFGLMLHPRTGE